MLLFQITFSAKLSALVIFLFIGINCSIADRTQRAQELLPVVPTRRFSHVGQIAFLPPSKKPAYNTVYMSFKMRQSSVILI